MNTLLKLAKFFVRVTVCFAMGIVTIYAVMILADQMFGGGPHGTGYIASLVATIFVLAVPLGFGIYKMLPEKLQTLP